MFGTKKDSEFSKCCNATIWRSPKIDGYKPYCTKCQKQCELNEKPKCHRDNLGNNMCYGKPYKKDGGVPKQCINCNWFGFNKEK